MESDMSFSKSLLYAGGLLMAVGGPIGYFSVGDVGSALHKHLFSGRSAKPSADPQSFAPTGARGQKASSAVSARPLTLEEALRFDVTVEWVMQRWPRVSTGLSYMQLQGYRVPLVTGTSLRDVAGSLTYYFNAGQQVQRIAFRGTVGDPSPLVTLLTSRYRFARRLTNDPGLVVYEVVDSDNKLAGTLKLRSAHVVKASQPYSRFEIDLAIDRPE
jgi:hypothetical protein